MRCGGEIKNNELGKYFSCDLLGFALYLPRLRAVATREVLRF